MVDPHLKKRGQLHCMALKLKGGWGGNNKTIYYINDLNLGKSAHKKNIYRFGWCVWQAHLESILTASREMFYREINKFLD